MRKSALATFITTLTLVAVTIVAACSPDRPDTSRRTAVPNDMPGARNSSAVSRSTGSIQIAYPLAGTVLTNSVTIQGSGQIPGAEYHVGVATGGRYLAEGTVVPDANGDSDSFSFTLAFEPVAAPSDGEILVYTTSPDNGSVDQQAVVPVKLAPAHARAISGPVIHLSPDNGKAGTPVVVLGEGFPPDSPIEVRLSGVNTEATRQAYIAGRTGTAGDFKLSLTMPAFWPNGDPILAPQVLVVASTPDFVSKATATFAYMIAVAPEAGTALPGDQTADRTGLEVLPASVDEVSE